MTLGRELVELLALEPPRLGDQLRGSPLGHDVVALLQPGRERPLAGAHRVRAHRHARHVLDAARDDDIVLTRHHAQRGEVGRLLPRAAHPVERRAAHVHREARDQRRVARDVEPLLTELVDAAEDDVLDLGSVDADAGDELAKHVRREVVGADGGESAVPLSDGATHGSNDDGVSHGGPPEVMTSTESRFILQETGRRSTAASRKRRTLTSARVF